ncbi:hypothetical protein HMPREF3293_00393 [Christensenella minuta]|uniref:Uncharacterized protein n=1 Tax=Christensenella minuta TaxID=626937 RepID=A0A136Q7T0_9FIRM|nr:hypothetical protein HMPREF3293_00393 [Christensenella minuta]
MVGKPDKRWQNALTKRIFVCYNKNIKMLNFNKNVSEFADLSFFNM